MLCAAPTNGRQDPPTETPSRALSQGSTRHTLADNTRQPKPTAASGTHKAQCTSGVRRNACWRSTRTCDGKRCGARRR
eukprot:3520360-Rhodomonas_salina.1